MITITEFKEIIISSSLELKNVKRILVFRPDQIGDVVLTTPLFENLKTAYQDSNTIAMIGPWARGVLENNPFIDEVICYRLCFYDRDSRYNIISRFINVFKLILLIRKEKIDLFIDLKGHLKTLLFCYLSGAKYRIGKSNAWRGCFLTRKIPYTEGIYEKVNNLNVVSLVAEASQKKLSLFPGERNVKRVNELLSKFSTGKSVALFPYAPSVFRRLPVEYFSRLTEYFNSRGFTCIYLGADDSNNYVRSIKYDKSINIDLTGTTSLLDTYLVLKRSDYCVTLDTAGAHLAAAAEIPSLVIFTCANPARWTEGGSNTVILHKPPSCFPCKMVFGQTDCPEKRKCLTNISCNDLLEASGKLLNL